MIFNKYPQNMLEIIRVILKMMLNPAQEGQNGGRLDVKIPASPIAAPEGWYLLFVMVDDVPSEGRLLRILPPTGTAVRDTIGNALRGVKSADDVLLDWRWGPLNPSRYNLHRTAVKALVAPTSSGIGSVPVLASMDEEQWTDAGAVSGFGPIALYQVLGRNCDGTSSYP